MPKVPVLALVLLILVGCQGGQRTGETTSKLCGQITAAADAADEGRFAVAGTRLGRGIAADGPAADPAVRGAAVEVLTNGVTGDLHGAAEALQAASDACARAGAPIPPSGQVHCVRAPCP